MKAMQNTPYKAKYANEWEAQGTPPKQNTLKFSALKTQYF
jgi:hypothetical protein